jgi:nitroimidazol reductase NimA-like FMN-containing flavoprotein (pyridoxamine 5'-phosphate oxidase superfamily)
MKTYILNEISEIESIINECKICFVGVVDGDNCPYVFPMNFAYINSEIILHSAPIGKHIDLLKINNKVCVTFCTDGNLVFQHPEVACSYRMDSKSVICKGEVTFIDDISEKELILNEFMAKYTERNFTYSQPALRNVKVWRVKVIEMTAKAFGQKHHK